MAKLAQPFNVGPNSCYKRVERSTSALLTSSPIADVRGSQTAIEVRKVTLAGELHLSHRHPEDTGSLEPFFFFLWIKIKLRPPDFSTSTSLWGSSACATDLELAFLPSVALCFSKAVEILFWKHCGERKQEAGRTFSAMQKSKGRAVSIFLDPTHELVLQQQQDMSGEVKRKANM